jgi:hypothetical protein
LLNNHLVAFSKIIEKVLGYLCQDNLSELFNARLVCRQWNYYSTRILRRKFYLSFGGHKYNIGRLKTFLDEFETNFTPSKSSQSGTDNSISFPVVRFRLFSDLFQECNKSTVMDFMTKCGPFTEALVIYKDINSDIEYTLEELSLLHFPRLKELAFSDRRRSHFSLDANQQTFLYHLILSAKEVLTSLAIKYPREPIYEIYEKEELLVKILTQCKMPKLRHLKLDMSVTDKVLRALSDLNLRLQGLQLCLGASTFSSDSLKKVLTSVRTTLEELRLTDLYRRAALTVDMPRMDLVHTFEIHGIELPAYFVAFPNFSYESKLPNLKKLQLNTWAPTKDWEVLVPELVKSDNDDKNNNNNSILQKKVYQKNQQSILTIAKISELSLAMNFTCPALMLRVASLFSGVKTLELHFSRGSVQALQTVFKHMGQLEELKLNQSYLGELATNCIDDVLTGMDAEQCRWILKKKAFLGIDLGRMEKQPCISDLKSNVFHIFCHNHKFVLNMVLL